MLNGNLPAGIDKIKPCPARHLFLMAAALAIIIFVQYMPALDFGFLGWDDTAYIQEDALASKGLGKDSLRYAFTTFDNPYFMPFTRLSYMADISLYGLKDAWGFHLTNMLLHISICMMIFLLVYQATSRLIAAFLSGLIFGIHPAHVEAVVWIAGRKELLAGFFGIIALLAYQKYAVANDRKWYLITVIAYGCSLLNKPIWIVLPLLLLLWDYFPLKRLTVSNARQCIVEKVPFLIIGIIYSFIFTYALQVPEIPVSYFPKEPWATRWMLPILALGKYVMNTFIPFNPVPYYAFPDQVNSQAGLAWTGLMVVLLYAFWKMRARYPGLLMASLWFGLGLAAALKITLFPQGEAIFVGDRYSYLPHIGVFVGLILSGDAWLNKHGKYVRVFSMFLMVIMLAGLLHSSKNTIRQWQSPEKLWSYTLERTEGKGQAYVLGVLASHYEKQQRYNEAIIAYKKSHEIYPEQFIYPLMVGSLLATPFQRFEESREWFDKVLDESPAPAKILFDYGKNEYMHGGFIRAERYLEKAAERSEQGDVTANMKDINFLLGLTQMRNHQMEKGIDAFKKANLSPKEKTDVCRQLMPGEFHGSNTNNTQGMPGILRSYCLEQDD